MPVTHIDAEEAPMSSTITLNPKSRRENKAKFNAKNPWAVGKTLTEVKELVDAGEHTLKGGFVFPEPTKKARASRTVKGGSPKGAKRATTVTKRTKKEKAAAKAKREAFVQWLGETAEERKAHKKANRKQAAWMRENGLVPSGAAWEAVNKGERDIATLKAIQANEPAKGKAKATKVKAEKKATQLVAEVEESKPARAHRANGSFMTKDEAEKFHAFRAAGLSVDEARKAVEALV